MYALASVYVIYIYRLYECPGVSAAVEAHYFRATGRCAGGGGLLRAAVAARNAFRIRYAHRIYTHVYNILYIYHT